LPGRAGRVIVEHGDQQGVIIDPLGDRRRGGDDGSRCDGWAGDQRAGEHPAACGQAEVQAMVQAMVQAEVQVEELTQHRAAEPGHVPAQGGSAGRFPGAAEHDQLPPLDRGGGPERQLDPDVDPAAPADDQRSGVRHQLGSVGQVGADRQRRRFLLPPALSHAGPGRPQGSLGARSQSQPDRQVVAGQRAGRGPDQA